MGKINQGIFGGVSGKVGNLIGASWKGINYLRIKPANVANPRTQLQQTQRSKFGLMLKFLRTLLQIINLGFKKQAVKMTPFNSALSYNVRNAVAGEFPDVTIDFEKVVLSNGSIPGPEEPFAEPTEGAVNFTWTNNSDEPDAQENDTAVMIVYCPETGQSLVNEDSMRIQENGSVQVPVRWIGETVHCWLMFKAPDGLVSNSAYAGEATIV